MRSKKKLINYSEIPTIYAVLLATLYFVVGGILINGAIQIGCFFLLIVLSLLPKRDMKVSILDLLWLFSLIPFSYCISDWSVADIRDFVGYFAFVFLVVCVKPQARSLDRSIKILYIMAFFHLFFVALHVIFKDTFNDFIYSILAPGGVETFTRAVKGNYYTGFGYIPGDTSGYLVNGILILLFFYSGNIKNRRKIILVAVLMLGILER